MKAQGPKSIVSPEIAMLSVFMTPWTKPIDIQRATSAAWRPATASTSASAGFPAPASSG